MSKANRQKRLDKAKKLCFVSELATAFCKGNKEDASKLAQELMTLTEDQIKHFIEYQLVQSPMRRMVRVKE